jgi:hypothetical protein
VFSPLGLWKKKVQKRPGSILGTLSKIQNRREQWAKQDANFIILMCIPIEFAQVPFCLLRHEKVFKKSCLAYLSVDCCFWLHITQFTYNNPSCLQQTAGISTPVLKSPNLCLPHLKGLWLTHICASLTGLNASIQIAKHYDWHAACHFPLAHFSVEP